MSGVNVQEFSYQAAPDDLAPELSEFLSYWNEKCGARAMPGRQDIDPVDLPRHLPFFTLVDVLDGGRDFRFRLLGTGITGHFNRDSTGKTVREAYATAAPEVLAWMLASMNDVVATKRPGLMRGILRAVQKDHISFEVLHVPLSEDGKNVSMLLGRARFIGMDK